MTGVDNKLAKRFQEFLESGGAEILKETNAWELARFKTSKGTCVVYQNSKGRVSFNNEYAHEAYAAFSDKRTWAASAIKERVRRRSVEELLIERDGTSCFFCGASFIDEIKPTLEHLLSISDGGSNHMSNLVLACELCNFHAGSLPIVEKVALRDMLRSHNKESV